MQQVNIYVGYIKNTPCQEFWSTLNGLTESDLKMGAFRNSILDFLCDSNFTKRLIFTLSVTTPYKNKHRHQPLRHMMCLNTEDDTSFSVSTCRKSEPSLDLESADFVGTDVFLPLTGGRPISASRIPTKSKMDMRITNL